MDKEQRDFLRDKHADKYGSCAVCREMREFGSKKIFGPQPIKFPCTVIQLLDELEMWVKE